MKFSVFTVSLPEYSPEEDVAILREFGYAGIEWRVIDQQEAQAPGFWAGNRCTWPLSSFVADAPRIRALTEGAGLAMPNVGTYTSCEDVASVEQAMRGVAALGAPQLRVNVPRYDGSAAYLKARDQAIAQYREVAELARQYRLRALIEIHMGSLISSASAAAAFLSNFDPRFVGAIYDPGNMVHEGHEQFRLGLETLGPYLAHVHLKNARWQPTGTRADGSTEWQPGWAPIAHGIVDMGLLLRALQRVGYNGWLSFEDFSTEQPLRDRVRDNIAYIKQVAQSVDLE